MSRNIYLILLLYLFPVAAQQKLLTRNGKVVFEASLPSFEEIKGCNESASCAFDQSTGRIVSNVPMRNFKFKWQLMQEHFNENYLETNRYPKSVFKGKITDFDVQKLTSAFATFNLTGKLEIRGKTHKIATPAKIRKTPEGIQIVADFMVNTKDYNIVIPYIIRNKVSQTVSISTDFTLQ